MYAKYKDVVEFYMVYIREAHPTDGWQSGANVAQNILFKQPTTLRDRASIASEMCSVLKLTLPPLVDRLDDRTNLAYSAWPDRLYLVGTDGRIAYKGGQGPGGFKADELRTAIEQYIERQVDR